MGDLVRGTKDLQFLWTFLQECMKINAQLLTAKTLSPLDCWTTKEMQDIPKQIQTNRMKDSLA